MTSSIYGDPKLFDLQKQVHVKAKASKPEWRSPKYKKSRMQNDDLE